MKLKFILFFLLNSIIFSCNNQNNELEDGVYAEINTSLGTMLIELNYKETPVTVANFIALSKGTHPDVKQQFKGELKEMNGVEKMWKGEVHICIDYLNLPWEKEAYHMQEVLLKEYKKSFVST